MLFHPIFDLIQARARLFHFLRMADEQAGAHGNAQGIHNFNARIRIIFQRVFSCDLRQFIVRRKAGRETDIQNVLALLQLFLKECLNICWRPRCRRGLCSRPKLIVKSLKIRRPPQIKQRLLPVDRIGHKKYRELMRICILVGDLGIRIRHYHKLSHIFLLEHKILR